MHPLKPHRRGRRPRRPASSIDGYRENRRQYILSTDLISGFRVEKYVVMPNHIHMILWIEGGPPRSPWPGPYGFGCGRRVEEARESETGL